MIDFKSGLEQVLSAITPDIHANLKEAIELGRWQNGDRLSSEQLDYCMQAVIAYDRRNLPEEERVAYIDKNKLTTKQCPD